MENINKYDSLGRKQGLWFYHCGNGNICWKSYYLNGEEINYGQNFSLLHCHKLSYDSFHHIIF